MHDEQEEDLNSCLDHHRFDINQLREDHNSLREDYQELEAEAAALRICLHNMQNCLCRCAERRNPLSLWLALLIFLKYPPLPSIPWSSILPV